MSAGRNCAQDAREARSPVWDCHVHCYPAEVIRDPAGWARQHGEPHWQHLVTHGPQGWADPDALLRTMDRDGIAKVLLQAWYWENPDTARLQNEWHAHWIARHPDRFLACAAIHPAMPDPAAELRAAAAWGACAVGECLPQVQSPEGWRNPGWEQILAWTTAAGWPVCIHVTEPVGHRYPGRIETPLMELADLFASHPGQKWLCAHWGGGLPFHALNPRLKGLLRNVWFDTAASPLLYAPAVWEVAVRAAGADRILFGSDFPLLLYPRSEREPGWARLLAEFRGSGLAPADLAAISSGNLQRLLGA